MAAKRPEKPTKIKPLPPKDRKLKPNPGGGKGIYGPAKGARKQLDEIFDVD